jgi:SAM-dependent methyltransferase
MKSFNYSPAFETLIRELHRGKESLPHYCSYLKAHLGGPESRLVQFCESLVPEMEHHCGTLVNRSVLDFGCGTGATTVAVALAGARVTAFDVHAESIRIAEQRVREHGLEDRITIRCAASTEEALTPDERFDVVLMNGVIEHIPSSVPGLRRRVIRSAWEHVKEGGFLFINDTPNRLIPFDAHTTQLWWIPWMSPGSEWAYRRAVSRGRFAESKKGAKSMEEGGAWGSTYWEVLHVLGEADAACVNLEAGHDEQLCYVGDRSWRRRSFERLIRASLGRALRAPITAFAPGLTSLCFRKRRSSTNPASETAPSMSRLAS